MTVNESQIQATLLESLDLDQEISDQERGIMIAIAHKVVVHAGFRLDLHQLIKLSLVKPWGW